MQKAVDWRGEICNACLKGKISSCAVCIVGSPLYYSFWVFKLFRHSMQTCSHCGCLKYECLLRKHPTLVNRRNLLFNDNARPYSARITPEKNIRFTLVCSTPLYSHQILHHQVIFFCFLQNALNNIKFSQDDQLKMFVENFFSSKWAEFL